MQWPCHCHDLSIFLSFSGLFFMAVLILLHLSIQLLGIHMSLKPRARSFTCVLGSRAFQRHCRTSYARLLATSMCLVLLLGWFWRFAAVHTVSVFFLCWQFTGLERSPEHALAASRNFHWRAHSSLTILFSSFEGCLLQRLLVLICGMVGRGFHVQLSR